MSTYVERKAAERGKSYAQQVRETVFVMIALAGIFTLIAKFVPVTCR